MTRKEKSFINIISGIISNVNNGQNYLYKKRFVLLVNNTFRLLRIFLTNLCCFYVIFIHKNKDYLNIKLSQNILLINTGDLGDNILTFGFISKLQLSRVYNVSVLIKQEYYELYKKFDGTVRIVLWDKNKYKRNPLYKIKFLSNLSRSNFDIAFNITPERGILNEELTLLSRASQMWRLSKDSPFLNPVFRHFLNNKYNRIFACTSNNEYLRLDKVLESLGVNNRVQKNISQARKKMICISPFSSDKQRDWNISGYDKLIKDLPVEYIIYLLGTKDIPNSLSNTGRRNIVALFGKTGINDLIEIIRSAELFIGNDSGLTHLALHLNTPLIAIIGGGMYKRFFPYNSSNLNRYLYHTMDCFGCGWNCIYAERYCISKVKSEEVISNAFEILSN